MCELFDKLNEPFTYIDYEYNKEDNRVYVNGQAMAERLNKVLGVGFWKYEPVIDTIKILERKGYNEKSINMVTLLINFEFYNKDLAQWIKFTDAGSQDLNIKMTEGDGTKSAITDGMKKCASRIGVASDLYKGLIDSAKDAKHPDGGYAILPLSYKAYYESKGWKWPHRENTGNTTTETTTPTTNTPTTTLPTYTCQGCKVPISKAVHEYSTKNHKKSLCQKCQKLATIAS